jgi:hypothetical protein
VWLVLILSFLLSGYNNARPLVRKGLYEEQFLMAKLFLHTRESSFRAKAQWQLCIQPEEIRFIDDEYHLV